jgi:hypothetical protein
MDKEPYEPTQQTEKGLTIPVPTRDDIEDALARVAKPQVSRLGRKRRPKDK